MITTNLWEYKYAELVKKVLAAPLRPCRNGYTHSIFGEVLEIEESAGPLPLLTFRRMYPKGILGEMAAFLKGPKSVEDFKLMGCNYWDLWANEDGSINVDYGNKWLDFHGANQLHDLIQGLVKDPYGRRHLITAWDPSNLANLSLPCCHYAYQWYVTSEGKLDMLWHQRSADLMVGVPSDVALARLFNTLVAQSAGYEPGLVKLVLGDVHIYEEHITKAEQYLSRVERFIAAGNLEVAISANATINNFEPSMVTVKHYDCYEPISFVLKP